MRRWNPTGGFSVGNPTLLAIGPDGLVYVRNRNERIIRVFTTTGTPVRTFGGSLSPNNTGDLEIDAAGNVYTIDLDKIVKFNAAGAVVGQFTPIPGIHADRLLGLAVAADGSLYVTVDPRLTGLTQEPPFLVHLDASGRRLADPAPLLNRLMGAKGTRSKSYNARDIDFANGRLYIAQETGFSSLGVITPNGELVDAVGGGRGEQVAVRGDDVYATGLQISAAPVPPRSSALNPSVGHLKGIPIQKPKAGDSKAGGSSCDGWADNGGRVARFTTRGGQQPNCRVYFLNNRPPCGSDPVASGKVVYLGGEPVTRAVVEDWGSGKFFVELPPGSQKTGSVVVLFYCLRKESPKVYEAVYEWKGDIDVKLDPSGNVLDASTSRPVAGAVVRLQFSVRKEGPFGGPSVSAHSPAVNPQMTATNGFFGWDVAEGFWRLRVTAFGYKPFTSQVYKVPPEVKGLKLKLRPDPRQQARVIDPHAGRAGSVRVGAKLKTRRIAGLRLKIMRGRVRSITVRSRAYRTVPGLRLGTPSADLLSAYPPRARGAITRLLTSRKPVRHRVGKATFTVRGGRVVAITLGR